MANNAQAPKMQPGASAVRRNAPAGDFIDHFMSVGDNRTHCERINPLDNGESFGWCPGANRGFQPQPLQTFNISDRPITAQLSAPVMPDEPPPIVLASESDVAPVAADTEDEPVIPVEPVAPVVSVEPPTSEPREDDLMSDDAVEAIAEALVHGKAEIAAATQA